VIFISLHSFFSFFFIVSFFVPCFFPFLNFSSIASLCLHSFFVY
jgi:hypothetical protein